MIDNRDPNPLHLAQLQALNMLIKKGYSGDIEDIRDQLIEESYSKPEKIKEMVAEWNAMRYPKEAITHLLLSIYEYFPQVHKSAVYYCRGDQRGLALDRAAMIIASQNLGHNRESVVGEHYLRLSK